MSSKTSEWFERPDHPLMNNVILNSVFLHLGKKELKTCRLVCKTWNVLTIPFTREVFRIRIYGDKDNPGIYIRKLHTTRTTIQNFVEDFRSNTLGIPFARFRLGSFRTTDGNGQEFLKLCGDTTKEIQFLPRISIIVEDISELLKSTPMLEIFQIPKILHSCSGNVVKLFPDGLENSKPRLTSLKVLTVPEENLNERNKCCPTFLEELITAAHNISCLDMSDSYSTSSIEVLSLIEKLGRESSIQELEISVKESNHDDFADLLLRMTAKPKGLRLKTFRYNSSVGSLALQLIPLFKDTLESLHLDSIKAESTIFMEFPEMSRLTTMSLCIVPKDFKFKCINLNEIFPVLHELKLTQWSDHTANEFFPDSVPCPNMKTFGLFSSGMTLNGFNQMLTVFPNLTQLGIRIRVDGPEIMRQIWSQMTQLKSLNIYGRIQTKDSLDSVLTGISTHALQEMRDVVKNLEKMKTAVERREMILNLRNQHSTLPSITNLTSLSSLSINLCGGGQFLTDLSGYIGFYSMKRLKHLKVDDCELTKTCCEILAKDRGLESWTFTNSENKNIIPYVKNN